MLVQSCDNTLRALRRALGNNLEIYTDEHDRCSDQIGRLHGWERDVDGKSGHLDHKLRRSPQLRDELTSLLSELNAVAGSCESTLTSR